DEDLEAALLKVAKGVGIASQVGVEPVWWREGTFEGSDGIGDVRVGKRRIRAWEGSLEQLYVGGDRRDTVDSELRGGHAHLDGVENRALCLLFDVGGTAVPELRVVKRGVEGRR